MDGVSAVRGLADRGVWGFEFHDNDLIPLDATPAQAKKIKDDVQRIMDDTGILCCTGTTNLFTHPCFKDGAFTSHDPSVRAYAFQKAMNAIDAAAEFKAKNFIFWGGREGAEVDGAKDPIDALKRFREAINFLAEYVRRNKYHMTFTIEPKPNEPRGDIYLPTVGSVLAFVETLDKSHRKMVGVNPEVAHIKMAGLNPYHEYGQALEAGKLFELHLNDQKPLRYDQDLSFASVDLKDAFYIIKLMVDHKFKGPKAFDAHAYRSENEAGVWDFVARCMRTYKILESKVKQANADPEINALLEEIHDFDRTYEPLLAKCSPASIKKLREAQFNPDKLATSKQLPYERLDQLITELILGVR
jgi:xylose isomerase